MCFAFEFEEGGEGMNKENLWCALMAVFGILAAIIGVFGIVLNNTDIINVGSGLFGVALLFAALYCIVNLRGTNDKN